MKGLEKWIKGVGETVFAQKLVGFIGSLYIRFCFLTTRWQVIGVEHLDNAAREHKTVFGGFWHRGLAFSTFSTSFLKPRPITYAVISGHRDGKMMAELARFLGVRVIAGSRRRGGAKASFEILNKAIKDGVLGTAVDGPTGPPYILAKNIVLLAQLGEYPLIPFAWSVSRCVRLKSWDKLIVPLPFSKGAYVFGKITHIPKNISEEELEKIRLSVQNDINEMTKTADTLVGRPDLWNNG